MNEFAPISGEEQNSEDWEKVIRTARTLEKYKQFFGPELGQGNELILDIGAGDSTTADEIAELSDYHAQTIRLDFDYLDNPPEGNTPAVAADATKMPFANESFDRLVSLWMMPHVGSEVGSEVVAEMIRITKPGGKIMLFPGRPFKRLKSEIAVRQSNDGLTVPPTLIITKPDGFDQLSDDDKQSIYSELSGFVSYGGAIHKVAQYMYGRAIDMAGTHRTTEQGRMNSLDPFKKKRD